MSILSRIPLPFHHGRRRPSLQSVQSVASQRSQRSVQSGSAAASPGLLSSSSSPIRRSPSPMAMHRSPYSIASASPIVEANESGLPDAALPARESREGLSPGVLGQPKPSGEFDGHSTSGESRTLTRLLSVKTVGTLGGFALLFNNVTGPGIASIAQVYQSSGWVVTTLAFLIFGILATFCSLLLVESVQSVPGNAHFQGQVEFSTLINFYFGKRAHRVGQFFLWATLESTAILSIIQSSQAMDNLLIDIFGRTCGLALGPAVTGWTCITTRQESLSSFGNVFTLFTLGFLLVVVLILPMSLFVSMDGNIWVQTGVHFVTIYIFVQWFISSCVKGLDRHLVPPIGSGSGFAQLFGVVMLNYASVTTVPSWVNVRKKSVNIQSSLWSSNMFACLSFVLLGAVPGSAFLIPDDSNFISIVALHDTLNRVDSYLFTISLIMSSIPVFFLIARDNLVHNQILTQARATWFTHVLPWFIAIPFLNGPFLTYLTVWTSLVFASVTNFTIPVLIYYKARRFRRIYNERRYLTPHQRRVLLVIHEHSHEIQTFLARRRTRARTRSNHSLHRANTGGGGQETMMGMGSGSASPIGMSRPTSPGLLALPATASPSAMALNLATPRTLQAPSFANTLPVPTALSPSLLTAASATSRPPLHIQTGETAATPPGLAGAKASLSPSAMTSDPHMAAAGGRLRVPPRRSKRHASLTSMSMPRWLFEPSSSHRDSEMSTAGSTASSPGGVNEAGRDRDRVVAATNGSLHPSPVLTLTRPDPDLSRSPSLAAPLPRHGSLVSASPLYPSPSEKDPTGGYAGYGSGLHFLPQAVSDIADDDLDPIDGWELAELFGDVPDPDAEDAMALQEQLAYAHAVGGRPVAAWYGGGNHGNNGPGMAEIGNDGYPSTAAFDAPVGESPTRPHAGTLPAPLRRRPSTATGLAHPQTSHGSLFRTNFRIMGRLSPKPVVDSAGIGHGGAVNLAERAPAFTGAPRSLLVIPDVRVSPPDSVSLVNAPRHITPSPTVCDGDRSPASPTSSEPTAPVSALMSSPSEMESGASASAAVGAAASPAVESLPVEGASTSVPRPFSIMPPPPALTITLPDASDDNPRASAAAATPSSDERPQADRLSPKSWSPSSSPSPCAEHPAPPSPSAVNDMLAMVLAIDTAPAETPAPAVVAAAAAAAPVLAWDALSLALSPSSRSVPPRSPSLRPSIGSSTAVESAATSSTVPVPAISPCLSVPLALTPSLTAAPQSPAADADADANAALPDASPAPGVATTSLSPGATAAHSVLPSIAYVSSPVPMQAALPAVPFFSVSSPSLSLSQSGAVPARPLEPTTETLAELSASRASGTNALSVPSAHVLAGDGPGSSTLLNVVSRGPSDAAEYASSGMESDGSHAWRIGMRPTYGRPMVATPQASSLLSVSRPTPPAQPSPHQTGLDLMVAPSRVEGASSPFAAATGTLAVVPGSPAIHGHLAAASSVRSRPTSPFAGSVMGPNGGTLGRRASLPMHPKFRSPAFRSVPKWVPIPTIWIAHICIMVTLASTIANIIYNIAEYVINDAVTPSVTDQDIDWTMQHHGLAAAVAATASATATMMISTARAAAIPTASAIVESVATALTVL